MKRTTVRLGDCRDHEELYGIAICIRKKQFQWDQEYN